MKATTWLCPVLTLVCATRLVCTAQRSDIYPLDYADTNAIQNDYLLEKRNKPSLSIVNPLDVLRQRLLLEIARRQMKENTRQVELNRAILKNVGKRMLAVTGPYQPMLQQQHLLRQHLQQLQPRQQLLLQHYQNQLDYMPAASIFDFLQRPAFTADALDVEEKSPLLDNGEDDSDSDSGIGISIGHGTTKYQLNGNEIVNETTNHNKNSNSGSAGRRQAVLVGVKSVAGEEPLAAHEAPFEGDADNDVGVGEGADGGNAAQMRYLQYRLHNNRHYTKK